MAAFGLLTTLIGFRVIRFYDDNYEGWLSKWGTYFRLAGPGLIAIGLLLAFTA